MILPEHIKVGFEIYRVAIGSGIEGEGECHPEKGSILVKAGVTDRRMAATVLHEVLHACWDQAALPEGEKDLTGLKEEDVISRLEPFLTAALLDSPQLRQMLERVAGAANGTCWKENEHRAEVRRRLGAMTLSQLEAALERPENVPVDNPDNERRSVDSAVS